MNFIKIKLWKIKRMDQNAWWFFLSYDRFYHSSIKSWTKTIRYLIVHHPDVRSISCDVRLSMVMLDGCFVSHVHKCLKFSFGSQIFMVHHSGFNPLSSSRNFSLDLFWPEPMELVKPHEDFFFKSYQKFKAKRIEKLYLINIHESMIASPPQPIIDEPMSKPKALPSNQDNSNIIHPPISYKRPRDNNTTPLVSPKIKQFYKPNLTTIFPILYGSFRSLTGRKEINGL